MFYCTRCKATLWYGFCRSRLVKTWRPETTQTFTLSEWLDVWTALGWGANWPFWIGFSADEKERCLKTRLLLCVCVCVHTHICKSLPLKPYVSHTGLPRESLRQDAYFHCTFLGLFGKQTDAVWLSDAQYDVITGSTSYRPFTHIRTGHDGQNLSSCRVRWVSLFSLMNWFVLLVCSFN